MTKGIHHLDSFLNGTRFETDLKKKKKENTLHGYLNKKKSNSLKMSSCHAVNWI